MTSESRRHLAMALLIAVTAVWGSTFVLVKSALAEVSPLLFNQLRMLIATTALLLANRRHLRGTTRSTWLAAAVTGTLLGTGYQLQTAGLARTTAIKSAFLTGLVVVIVPLLSFSRLLRGPRAPKPGWSALAGAAIAFTGLFLLATPPGTAARSVWSTVSVGDLLTLGCALAFAGHLLALSRTTGIPTGQLATLQIACATLFMALTLPLGGALHLHWTADLALALGITGLIATAAAFSAQTWAQRHLSATTTALLFTLEPVFALVFSLAFLGETLSRRTGSGAVLILVGIAVTELFAPTLLPLEPL